MLWICEGCGTAYAAGLSRCPHCQGTEFHEQGRAEWIKEQNMPKITVHGGVSDAAAGIGPEPADTGEEDDMPVTNTTAPEGVEPAAGPADEDETTADEETTDEVLERPAVNDPKADWVDYAVALGMGRDDAEGHTKKDLIAECDRREAQGR